MVCLTELECTAVLFSRSLMQAMPETQSRAGQVVLTAEEQQRLTAKYNSMQQLVTALQQLGESAFKVAIQRPGELRNTTIALLAVDPSTAINEGQPSSCGCTRRCA